MDQYQLVRIHSWIAPFEYRAGIGYNVGMLIVLVPITGIPLPLLSYGGSSINANLLSLTIILNLSAKTKNYMFEGNK